MSDGKSSETNIREDVLEAMHTLFPDGIVEMPFHHDDSYFVNIYPKVESELRRIKGTDILYERGPEGEVEWDEEEDIYDDIPSYYEESSSYHLFFVGIADERFEFETESEEPDEDGVMQTVRGRGKIGCTAAISLLAPFAMIKFDDMSQYDNGSETAPDIFPSIFTMDFEPVDLEAHFRETMGEEAVERLLRLREEISKRLESLGIVVLSDEEVRKPVPWVKAGGDVWIGKEFTGEETMVRDVFFFRGP